MSIMWPVLLLSLGLAGYALLGWRQRGDTRDLRYGLVLLAWSALLAAGELGRLGAPDEAVRAATRGSYQLTILAVSAFLMAWVRGLGWGDKVLMASQAALGLFLAPLQAAALPAGWGQAWFWVNALGITALVLRLAHAIWRRTDAESWMVLLVAVLGLGVVLTDLRQAADGPALVSVSHYFFAVARCGACSGARKAASRTSSAITPPGAAGCRRGRADSRAPMRSISAGRRASMWRGKGLIWNTSAPTLSPSPSSAGCTNWLMASSVLRKAGLGARPRPSSARTCASQTSAGALTTKRKCAGTWAA